MPKFRRKIPVCVARKSRWTLVWVTFTVTLLIEKLCWIKINKTFLTTLAPFSLKIRPFKAKTVDLELFVCFTKLFGLWPSSQFSVLLCVFLAGRSAAVALMRRNILPEIHATEHATKAPQSQSCTSDLEIQNRAGNIGSKSLYRVNHYKLRFFKWFFWQLKGTIHISKR